MDALTDDFLSRCFGPAEEPMREFSRQLDGSHAHLVFDDQVGRMFRSLDEGHRLINQEADNEQTTQQRRSPEQRQQIAARHNDLVLYTRYVDLFHRYWIVEGVERQSAFETMLRHAYRMRRSMMVHAKAIYRDVDARDKNVSIPEDATWNVAEADNPWKSSEPFTLTEFAEDDFSSNHWTLETCLEKPRFWGRRTLPLDEPVCFEHVCRGVGEVR